MDLSTVYPRLLAALQVMYNDHTGAEERRQAQQYLIQLQKAPEAWDLGWLCLRQGSDVLVLSLFDRLQGLGFPL